jgi:hypothetical protein
MSARHQRLLRPIVELASHCLAAISVYVAIDGAAAIVKRAAGLGLGSKFAAYIILAEHWITKSVLLIFVFGVALSTALQVYGIYKHIGTTRRELSPILDKNFWAKWRHWMSESIIPSYVLGTLGLALVFALGHRAELAQDSISKTLIYIAAFLLAFEVVYATALKVRWHVTRPTSAAGVSALV